VIFLKVGKVTGTGKKGRYHKLDDSGSPVCHLASRGFVKILEKDYAVDHFEECGVCYEG